jgi:ATP-binding protein involved in chromosome partitioning
MKGYRDLVGDTGSGVEGQLREQNVRLQNRMATIRHTVAILSGKGGVGKSTLTSNLAAALAEDGARVAVLDADLNGPSLAKMMGVRGASLHIGPRGVEPPVGPRGIKVLSMDHLLPRDEAPVQWKASTQEGDFVWRASAEAAALREFLSDTAWGPLEFLLIDLAPGTDKISSLASLLPQIGAAVVVTLPTEVSHLTVRKSITVATGLWGASAVGVVENMAAYRCAHCGHEDRLFQGPDSAGMAQEMGVTFLGRVPFDPRLAAEADRGVPYIQQEPGTPCATALRAVGAALRSCVEVERRQAPAVREAEGHGGERRIGE